MTTRRRAELDGLTGLPFRPSLDLTLSKLLASFDLKPHLEASEGIVVVASQEAVCEQTLDRMHAEMSKQVGKRPHAE